jgi:hypothetical protein
VAHGVSRPVDQGGTSLPKPTSSSHEALHAAIADAIDDESFGRLADYLAEQRTLPDTEIYPPEPQVSRAARTGARPRRSPDA